MIELQVSITADLHHHLIASFLFVYLPICLSGDRGVESRAGHSSHSQAMDVEVEGAVRVRGETTRSSGDTQGESRGVGRAGEGEQEAHVCASTGASRQEERPVGPLGLGLSVV